MMPYRGDCGLMNKMAVICSVPPVRVSENENGVMRESDIEDSCMSSLVEGDAGAGLLRAWSEIGVEVEK